MQNNNQDVCGHGNSNLLNRVIIDRIVKQVQELVEANPSWRRTTISPVLFEKDDWRFHVYSHPVGYAVCFSRNVEEKKDERK